MTQTGAPTRKATGRKAATRAKPAQAGVAIGADARRSPHALDLENYAVAYLTWIANKVSSSASTIYRKRFGVGVTDWRIMALLAVEPWIPAARISEVIGFDKAVISRSLAFMQERGLVETRFHDNNFRRQFVALTRKAWRCTTASSRLRASARNFCSPTSATRSGGQPSACSQRSTRARPN